MFFCFRLAVQHSQVISSYVAVNEPIYSYDVGSNERQQLEEKLKEYERTIYEIPVVIGDEEIHTRDVKYQVRVCKKILN